MLNIHFIHVLKCELIKLSIVVSLGNKTTRVLSLSIHFTVLIFNKHILLL